MVLPYGNVAPHEILLVKTKNILFQNFFTSWLRQVLTSNFAARCWGHKLASELCYTTSDDGERAANLKEGIHHEKLTYRLYGEKGQRNGRCIDFGGA